MLNKLGYNVPGLLFPAISLLMLAHTNHVLDLASEARHLVKESGGVVAHHDWEVDVHVPLVHGILARHAEGEIRRFNQIELDIIQQELDLKMASLRAR